MKQTIEQNKLIAYLPYKLTFQGFGSQIYTMRGFDEEPILITPQGFVMSYDHGYKPIFRPLSSITEPIEHNGREFVPVDELQLHEINEHEDITKRDWANFNWSYEEAQKLFEWHFNVFNLPTDLWVDKRTVLKLEYNGK